MRGFSSTVPIIISVIAIYFALIWGADAVRVLSSPIYGLDDPTFARLAYDFSRLARLGSDGVLQFAAFFGALKLAVATIFIMHVADRVRGLWGRKADPDILEAALLLVVFATIAVAIPALLDGAPDLIRQHTLHLLLAAVAAMLVVVEHLAEIDEGRAAGHGAPTHAARSQAGRIGAAATLPATSWPATNRQIIAWRQARFVGTVANNGDAVGAVSSPPARFHFRAANSAITSPASLKA